jgi:membrane protease subunit HflC
MKSRTIQAVLSLIIILAIIIGTSAFYVVREGEQVVITQFGKPVGDPARDAGLHFKVPFIQKVNRFEKRILKWDGSPNQIPTKDKKLIWVDTTARWRITEPLRFLTRVRSMTTALSRLDGIIDSVVRDVVSNNNLVELVRGEGWEGKTDTSSLSYGQKLEVETDTVQVGRDYLMRQMLDGAAELTPEFGIELVDVRIKRVNYVESVLKKVFERMTSERKRIAAQYRSEGEGEAARITGEMSKELKRISSGAFRRSEELKGKADAEATRIYGGAFNQDPDFYGFFQTLEVYRQQKSKQTRLILTTDNDFYRYLKKIPE